MTLSGSRLKTLEALADTVIPPTAGALPSGTGSGVVELIDSLMDAFPKPTRAQIASLISAWEISPLAAKGFRSRFSSLSEEERERWVRRTLNEGSYPVKLGLHMLRQLIVLAYASTPVVEEAIGFDYTCRAADEVHGK